MRYTYLLLFLCLFGSARTVQAQCTADAVATSVTCFGLNNGHIDLTASNGTGPYTYLWSNNQTTEDISNLGPGTYICTVTDALACTATVTALVLEPTALLVTLDGLTILNCINTSTSITASVSGGSPPYTYLWSNGETNSVAQIPVPGTFVLTVTDVNGCTAVGGINIFTDSDVPLANVNQPATLTCTVVNFILDATGSSAGPNFIYLWATPDGNILSGANTLTPTIDAPGIYTLTVTNISNGCTSVSSVQVVQNAVIPIVSVSPNLELPCGGGLIALPAVGQGGPNFAYAWSTIDGNIVSGANTLNPIVGEPGTYTVVVVNTINGCTSTATVNVSIGDSGLCSQIKGRVLQDTLENCLADLGEPAASGWIVKAQGTLGTFYALTDANGDYQISVEAGGDYAVSAITPGVLWEACPPIPDILATVANETYFADDLLFQKLADCPLLSVDISSGNLRRCFSNNFFSVSYCNNGTKPAEDANVAITLDPLLSIVSANLPYTDLGGGILNFELGDLAVGQCGSFYFYTELSCNAMLGQTHCTEAHIYPDSSCIPVNSQWSGASLRITSACALDSVRFLIENVGLGDMPNALDYIIIEDQVMLMSAPVQLDAGQSVTVSVPANGSTWRLEVPQVAFHPGQSAPAVSVEGCTTGPTFTTGFVTQFPTNDADEFVDIHCLENTGSYDPNDKQGFPKGYGSAHYIRPGTHLEYLIRFQNTGNDTAFTVRILDTLSSWLDPSSIRPGASSHPYSWDLTGYGVLSFLFENILLPDSNVNEPLSHGFVKFTIDHQADAPLETVIENTAEIYFDFNDAIVTNTTSHRLGENFVTVGLWQPERPGYEVLVSPNPFSDAAILEVKGLHQISSLRLQVFDLQGKMQIEMDSGGPIFYLKKGGLPTGVYLFRIDQKGESVGAGKLIIQD